MGRLEARVGRLHQQSADLAAAARAAVWARCGQGRAPREAMDALITDVQQVWAVGSDEMAAALRRESGMSMPVARMAAMLLHREGQQWRRLYARDDGATLTVEWERLHSTRNVLSGSDRAATIAVILAWCRDGTPDGGADDDDEAGDPDAA